MVAPRRQWRVPKEEVMGVAARSRGQRSAPAAMVIAGRYADGGRSSGDAQKVNEQSTLETLSSLRASAAASRLASSYMAAVTEEFFLPR